MIAKLKSLDKKKASITIFAILMIIAFVLVLSKMTAAYLEPDEDTLSETNGVVTASGNTLRFTKGTDISLTPSTDNFATGSGNLTATTNPSATLIAGASGSTVTESYYVGILIEINTFVKTTSNAELILTVRDPSNNIVTTSSDSLTYTTVNGVSGFDVTGKVGAFNIKTNQSISTSSTTTGTTQNWSFTLTFVNLSGDQSANETATFDAEVVLSEKEIVYVPKYFAYSDPTTSSTQDYTTLTYNIFTGLYKNGERAFCLNRSNNLICFKEDLSYLEEELTHLTEVFSNGSCSGTLPIINEQFNHTIYKCYDSEFQVKADVVTIGYNIGTVNWTFSNLQQNITIDYEVGN